jgi:hypothetical protein
VRLRFIVPQLVVSAAIALATGHLWLLLLPLLGITSLLIQASKIPEGLPPRELAGRIWLGNKRLGRIPWLWPTDIRQAVILCALQPPESHLQTRFKSELAQPSRAPLVGISLTGEPVRLETLEEFGHAIIIGVTGSGKTEWLRLFMSQLQEESWLADYKGGVGLTGFASYRLMTTNLAENRSQFWQAAAAELANREAASASSPERRKVFLIIDELAAAIAEPDAQRAIDSIARKGRGLGMHLVAATQNLSGLPRAIWTNMQSRVLLAPADISDALQLGIDSKLLKGLSAHQGIIRSPNKMEAFWFEPIIRQSLERGYESETRNPLLDFSGQTAQNL